MRFKKLESSEIKDKYFYRIERWDWLNREMIHVFDRHNPRMITMDPWYQRVFLDATGEQTVTEYIFHLASQYPITRLPEGLDEMVLDVISTLVNEEKIVSLSDQPVTLEDALLNPMTEEGIVNLEGTWTGTYDYNLPEEYKTDRMKEVEFTIKINNVDGLRFTGTVQDNLQTGGTPGTGMIEGSFSEDDVSFYKRMPYLTDVDEKGRQIINKTRKHPVILYEGVFSRNRQHITGNWRFKSRQVIWKGIIPYWVPLVDGRFTMKKGLIRVGSG